MSDLAASERLVELLTEAYRLAHGLNPDVGLEDEVTTLRLSLALAVEAARANAEYLTDQVEDDP